MNGQAQMVNIGARLSGHAFLLGLINELAIFNVNLSQKQIDAIQKNGLKGALSADPQGKLTTSWAMIKTYQPICCRINLRVVILRTMANPTSQVPAVFVPKESIPAIHSFSLPIPSGRRDRVRDLMLFALATV